MLLDGRFGSEHPYGHPTIGSVPDLDAACLDDVTAFHSTWYRPDNAVLVISGCVEADEGLTLADKYLGAVPAATGDLPERIQGRVRHDNPRVVVTRPLPRTAVTRAWATPPITNPNNLTVAMATDILGSGMSSRLIRTLERERHLVDGVGMNDFGLARGTSAALVSAHLKPGVSEEELTGAVDEIITELAANGPSQAELERARAQVERSWLESLAVVDERADLLNMHESLLGTLPSSILTSTASGLSPQTTLPKPQDDGYPPSSVNRRPPGGVMKTCNERPLTSRPTVRPGSPWSFPQCLVETLPTGLTVVRVPMPGQRIVTMEIGLDAPLCTEPAGLEGLAGLVVRTADESTGPHPGAAFAEAMESIGASYDGSAGLAGSHVGVDVPVTRFDAAAELFVELLNTTSLVEEDIARQIDAARASWPRPASVDRP